MIDSLLHTSPKHGRIPHTLEGLESTVRQKNNDGIENLCHVKMGKMGGAIFSPLQPSRRFLCKNALTLLDFWSESSSSDLLKTICFCRTFVNESRKHNEVERSVRRTSGCFALLYTANGRKLYVFLCALCALFVHSVVNFNHKGHGSCTEDTKEKTANLYPCLVYTY